ncbi:MAG: hypothetical protein DMG98_02025 [Acidobacteria bacterium]|nr:MAG: hypothetical protein DMG98_02025 [Acidobacteriota bacterium]
MSSGFADVYTKVPVALLPELGLSVLAKMTCSDEFCAPANTVRHSTKQNSETLASFFDMINFPFEVG